MYKKLILKYQRFIDQAGILIPCYYYNYFKSPGLKTYPDYPWVNSDYNLIKVQVVANSDIFRIASNFYYVGSKFQLFLQVDYIIMMPLKPNSFSNMGQIITNLVTIIHKNNQESKIEFINDLFLVKPYRQFWKNRLDVKARKTEIANKIFLKPEYYHFFDNKKVIIIDDIVASGISIAAAVAQLQSYNNVDVNALCYGSVYQWEKIYNK